MRWGFGAGVDRKNHAPFEERFGFPLVEAWAMTETGAGGCVMANREPRLSAPAASAAPSRSSRCALVDDEGHDVPPDTPGELLVRATGPDPRRHFFSGYLKDEAATDEAWAGGWFHTGDVVRRDADGSFYFVDRKKNVIRRSGENISAVEVESVLNQHPAVKASAVAATPDDGARRRGAGLHRHARAGRAPTQRRSSPPRIVDACARRSSPTTRRPATSPSSTRCRSRRRRRSSAASCARLAQALPGAARAASTRAR